MKHDAFEYEFTPKELAYFLFGKKKCPRCGGQMKKSKEYETITGADVNAKHNYSSRDYFPADSQKVKSYRYYFICKNCGARYSLSELAK